MDIPLGIMTCVTGVSGSGKSSLVNEILYKKLARRLNKSRIKAGKHDHIIGYDALDKIINIDQSPIGRTPRSNPATYTGTFDLIRDLFAGTKDAKARGYGKGRFSFNVSGGRCEACRGDGIIKIEMHFLPDIYVPCEVCGGKRYNRETLEVKYKGKSINEVLDMTVDEACEFFANVPRILRKIDTLRDVDSDISSLDSRPPLCQEERHRESNLQLSCQDVERERRYMCLMSQPRDFILLMCTDLWIYSEGSARAATQLWLSNIILTLSRPQIILLTWDLKEVLAVERSLPEELLRKLRRYLSPIQDSI